MISIGYMSIVEHCFLLWNCPSSAGLLSSKANPVESIWAGLALLVKLKSFETRNKECILTLLFKVNLNQCVFLLSSPFTAEETEALYKVYAKIRHDQLTNLKGGLISEGIFTLIPSSQCSRINRNSNFIAQDFFHFSTFIYEI